MTENQWQPSSAKPWPDQVNEQLSRHGVGLEAHEREIDDLAALVGGLRVRIEALERRLVALEARTL